jgi:hypothetical protein
VFGVSARVARLTRRDCSRSSVDSVQPPSYFQRSIACCRTRLSFRPLMHRLRCKRRSDVARFDRSLACHVSCSTLLHWYEAQRLGDATLEYPPCDFPSS